MIPKKIHYCWFGKGNKSEFITQCINTWKNKLPEYEIIEWNEDNFDVNACDFTSKAYSEKKWAFVADYARLYALYNCGGIYLDTDVEVIKDFTDSILNNKNFLCFEDSNHVSTACIGAEKHSSFIKECMEYYDQISYKDEDKLSIIPNSEIIFDYLFEQTTPEFKNQLVKDVMVFTCDYFSPKSYYSKKINITDNTVCIHHFDGTWKSKSEQRKDKIKIVIRRLLGDKLYLRLKSIKKRSKS